LKTSFDRFSATYWRGVGSGSLYGKLRKTARPPRLARYGLCRSAAAGGRTYDRLYHPALTYYAADYGLEQLAVEHDGKEPSARHLARLIEEARRKKVRHVFYQAQYPASTVKVIAEDIGARSVKIDPLREDVIENIGEITRQLTSGNE